MQITQTTGPLTMSSREIADLVDSRHDDVKRSIERLADRGVITPPPLAEVSNTGPGPKTISVYLIGKRDSYVIVAQLSPEFTARLVDRWQELEAAVSAPAALPSYAEALRQLADKIEETEQQKLALQAAAPKVAFVDRYVEADSGLKGFRQVAKLLKANESEFRRFLTDEKIMYRLGGEWVAHQPHLDASRFEMKTGEAHGHAFNRCLFTAKGVEWVAGMWAKRSVRLALAEA